MYKDFWTSSIGEMLKCRRKFNNTEDQYAVAVMNSGSN